MEKLVIHVITTNSSIGLLLAFMTVEVVVHIHVGVHIGVHVPIGGRVLILQNWKNGLELRAHRIKLRSHRTDQITIH